MDGQLNIFDASHERNPLDELVEFVNKYDHLSLDEKLIHLSYFDEMNEITSKIEKWNKNHPLTAPKPIQEERVTDNSQDSEYWKLIDKRLRKNGIRL